MSTPLDGDDSAIPGDERLFHRVLPIEVIFDRTQNRFRASSMAFDEPHMSIYLNERLKAHSLTPADVLSKHERYSLAEFTAAECRDHGWSVRPELGDAGHICDPAHGVVSGAKREKVRSKFAKLARLPIVGELTEKAQADKATATATAAPLADLAE